MSFQERLEKKVKQMRAKQQADFKLYVDECKRQGVAVGEPIGLLAMVEHRKEERKQ